MNAPSHSLSIALNRLEEIEYGTAIASHVSGCKKTG